MSWSRRMWLTIIVTTLVVANVISNPVRRSSNDPEARRRSAVDRHIIRFGRSSPAEPSAGDIKELLQNLRSGDSFPRLGKSQALSTEDLISIIRQFEDDNGMDKRVSSGFIRFVRDPSFIRFGKNVVDERPGYKERSDNFLRFVRDSEEMNETGLDVDEGDLRGQ